MKKLFMFLAVAGLATFGASCSSDDNSDEPVKVEAGQLAVKADKTEINAGESVKFSVTLDGKEEKGSELFIGDEQIYTPHKFEKAGEFEVVAKKKGAKDSAAVKITVKGDDEPEVPADKKTLVLKSNKLEVTVGEEVKFDVTDGTAAVKDVKIMQVGGVAVANGVWKATTAGSFKFVAEKDNYEKSNEVTIVVKEAPQELKNVIKVDGVVYKIDQARLLVEAEKKANGLGIREYVIQGDNGPIYFCRFIMDLRTNDFSINEDGSAVTKGAVSRVYKIVIQDPQSENYRLPGELLEAELNNQGWVLAKDADLAFTTDDILKFDAKMKAGLGDGGNTSITVSTDNILIDYTGDYTSMGAIDTSNNPNANSLKAKKDSSKAIKVTSFYEGMKLSNFK